MRAYDADGENGVLEFAEKNILSSLHNEGEKTQLIKQQDFDKYKLSLVCRATRID